MLEGFFVFISIQFTSEALETGRKMSVIETFHQLRPGQSALREFPQFFYLTFTLDAKIVPASQGPHVGES